MSRIADTVLCDADRAALQPTLTTLFPTYVGTQVPVPDALMLSSRGSVPANLLPSYDRWGLGDSARLA